MEMIINYTYFHFLVEKNINTESLYEEIRGQNYSRLA